MHYQRQKQQRVRHGESDGLASGWLHPVFFEISLYRTAVH